MNGSDIYGINSKGEIIRLNPSGTDWKFKPSVAARAVFAQTNGDLIVSANKGAQTLVWRVHPPDDIAEDSEAAARVRGGQFREDYGLVVARVNVSVLM